MGNILNLIKLIEVVMDLTVVNAVLVPDFVARGY